jgi:hypothetical protein
LPAAKKVKNSNKIVATSSDVIKNDETNQKTSALQHFTKNKVKMNVATLAVEMDVVRDSRIDAYDTTANSKSSSSSQYCVVLSFSSVVLKLLQES